MRAIFVLVFGVLSLAASAGDPVYRWVDKAGVIHYGAQPPNKDAKPATLPEIQTYSSRGGNRPIAAIAAAASKPAAGPIQEMRILSPVQDEVFRDGQGIVNVAVAVLPGLPEGAGVIFYLDGAAKNAKPSPSTSTSFTSVERGEHTVTAAVVDASGRELKRAPPVVFHSKPPSVKP